MNKHGIRNSTYTVELIIPPKVGVAIGLVMSMKYRESLDHE